MTEFLPQNSLRDVILIRPKRFYDERGYFSETYNQSVFEQNGISCRFVQDNHSLSEQVGVFRGFHFQIPPHAQDKLVRCVRGSILDIAIDIRHGSPGFGESVAVELSAENGEQLFIPKGFAHAFCTLTPETEVQYKVSAHYDKDSEAGIAFNDSDLNLDYPIAVDEMILSEKDLLFPTLANLPKHFEYQKS